MTSRPMCKAWPSNGKAARIGAHISKLRDVFDVYYQLWIDEITTQLYEEIRPSGEYLGITVGGCEQLTCFLETVGGFVSHEISTPR